MPVFTPLSERTPQQRIWLAGPHGPLCSYRLGSRRRGVLLVYLHGGPGYNSCDFVHFAAPHLTDLGEVFAFDQRGSGCSPRDPNPKHFSLREQVSDVRFVVKNEARGRPVVLIGHSYGGLLAVHTALRATGLLTGLVLVDAPLDLKMAFSTLLDDCANLSQARGDTRAAAELRAAIPARTLASQLAALQAHATQCIGTPLVPPGAPRVPESEALRLARQLGGYSPAELTNDGVLLNAVVAAWDDGTARLSRSDLERIRLPVLVVHGELDPYRKADVRALPPGWQSRVIPHAGHHSYRDAPLTFARFVERFVRARVLPSAGRQKTRPRRLGQP